MSSSPSHDQQEALALLFQLIADAQTTNYLAAAGVTLVLIEHISNFKDEVELIWTTRLGLIRYFTLLAVIVDVSFMFKEAQSDRVYVRIRLDAAVSVGVFTMIPLTHYVHVGPILRGCYALEVPQYFTFYATPPFITAAVLFSMTLYKCGSTLLSVGLGRTPVITLFLRDGVFWFLALVLVDIVLWHRGRVTLTEIPVVPTIGVIAVIGARVLLNIKKVTSTTVETLHGTFGVVTEVDTRHDLAGTYPTTKG
ncbi:hypothetical protein C8J57DRAFT_1669522 [Mycena rebaudengoi]|nr:hypothetical protein C8J57DRAFT_1669522 [Mycena rebaudengoi]